MGKSKQRLRVLFCAVFIIGVFGFAKMSAAIPAFPGAQGFGAGSAGGRGGKIVKVANLNDSGPGSFRAAVESHARHYYAGSYKYESLEVYQARLEAGGRKIVVFDVSGIINLKTDLSIATPYLTIAGQTSPGGILITGRRVQINTHDIIIQHMRFRLGTHGAGSASEFETFDTLDIFGNAVTSWYPNPAYNIIIDHCSISWSVDENVDIGLGANNVTIQWSIISEGLSNAGHPKGEHSKGLLISTKETTTAMNISLHHNYLAHNVDRNPLICCGQGNVVTDVVNNVIYNFKGGLSMQSYGNSSGNEKVNWKHNYVKQGPNSNSYAYEAMHTPTSGISPTPIIYTEGNIGSRRLDQSYEQWYMGESWQDKLLDKGFRSATPWTAPSVMTATMSPDVAACVLSAAGATAPMRDSVDTRVIDEFIKGTGGYKDNISYPAGFPVFTMPAPDADSDNDGMADFWEDANGLNAGADDSASDEDNDGYTNIEEYLHYLSAKSYTHNALCMGDGTIPSAPAGLTVK